MAVNHTMSNASAMRKPIDAHLEADEKLQTLDIAVMSTALFFIFLISIAGNLFVFLVFYKRPALITISNRFIVNLSICNVLDTVLVMPFVFAALVSGDWFFGTFWCQATGFVMNVIFAASTLTLVVISVDRYCAVVTPLHYSMRITSRRSVMMIITVWIVAVGSALPPLLGWNHFEYQHDKSVCTVLWASREPVDRYYTLVLVILCFILPLLVMVWVYVVIFRAARNNSERTRRNSVIPPNSVEDPMHTPLRPGRRRSSAVPILVHRLSTASRTGSLLWQRDEWKAAVTSCMVVFTFIVCWLLYFIIIILESLLVDPSSVTPIIKTASILLALSSCAFNPLVYVFRSKGPRVELRTILGIAPKRDISTCVVNGLMGSRRPSMNPSTGRGSPCVSRQSSEELEILQSLHHCMTSTTLTSMVVTEECSGS